MCYGLCGRIAVMLLVLSALPGTVAAQGLRAAVPGRVVERITSLSDSTETYAAYIPSSYDTLRAWPVAFVMDPRGNALNALGVVQSAAERYGYIVLSSYNTVSDGPVQPNVDAVTAMWRDAQALLRMDRRRVYLVGFSGTARLAWEFAGGMSGAVAGIFGAGASGLQFARSPLGRSRPPKPAYYGSFGTRDFNYDELHLFEPWLAQHDIAYRLRTFEGGHSWPGPALAEEAFGWFELRAMRAGLRSIDSMLVRELFASDTARARRLDAAGLWLESQRLWHGLARDYMELAAEGAALAAARAAELEADARVAAQREETARQTDAFVAYDRTVRAWTARVRREAIPPDVEGAIRLLRIAELKRTAAGNGASAAAARRMLEHAYVSLAFYLRNELAEQGRESHIQAVLAVASAIRDGGA